MIRLWTVKLNCPSLFASSQGLIDTAGEERERKWNELKSLFESRQKSKLEKKRVNSVHSHWRYFGHFYFISPVWNNHCYIIIIITVIINRRYYLFSLIIIILISSLFSAAFGCISRNYFPTQSYCYNNPWFSNMAPILIARCLTNISFSFICVLSGRSYPTFWPDGHIFLFLLMIRYYYYFISSCFPLYALAKLLKSEYGVADACLVIFHVVVGDKQVIIVWQRFMKVYPTVWFLPTELRVCSRSSCVDEE